MSRTYLRRLDPHGARFGAVEVSTANATLVALRTADAGRFLAEPPWFPGAPSRVTLSVNLDAGATLPAGSIAHTTGFSAVRWVTTEAVTNGGGSAATVTVPAVAEHVGPTPGPAGTITAKVSAVTGWNTVTNAADATPGAWPAPRPVATQGQGARWEERTGRFTASVTFTLGAGGLVPAGTILRPSAPPSGAVERPKYRTNAAAVGDPSVTSDVTVTAECLDHQWLAPAGSLSLDAPSALSAGTWGVLAVTNDTAVSSGRVVSGYLPKRGGPHQFATMPALAAQELWTHMDRADAGRAAVATRVVPAGDGPTSETPSWGFTVRAYADAPVPMWTVGGTWSEPVPQTSTGRAPRAPATWAVPFVVREAGNCPIGALVYLDPADIDGELQGAGRGWVPAVVTGYGGEVSVNGMELATTLRAARILVAALPPRAAALVRSGEAAGRLTARLLVAGGGAAALAFDGDDPRDVVPAYTVPGFPTIADLDTPADVPRWTSTAAVVLVELSPVAAPGVFRAV